MTEPRDQARRVLHANPIARGIALGLKRVTQSDAVRLGTDQKLTVGVPATIRTASRRGGEDRLIGHHAPQFDRASLKRVWVIFEVLVDGGDQGAVKLPARTLLISRPMMNGPHGLDRRVRPLEEKLSVGF